MGGSAIGSNHLLLACPKQLFVMEYNVDLITTLYVLHITGRRETQRDRGCFFSKNRDSFILTISILKCPTCGMAAKSLFYDINLEVSQFIYNEIGVQGAIALFSFQKISLCYKGLFTPHAIFIAK